jgi:RES domain-containing protein
MEHAGLDPTEDAERDLTTVTVDVQPVFDLSDAEIRRELNLSFEDITGDSGEALELCRSIADWVRSQGYNAILSPSAAMPSEKNLNIYLDVRPADLRVELGDVREPLNY